MAKNGIIAARRGQSWRRADAASDRLAARLQENGIVNGDRVAIFMDNRWRRWWRSSRC